MIDNILWTVVLIILAYLIVVIDPTARTCKLCKKTNTRKAWREVGCCPYCHREEH